MASNVETYEFQSEARQVLDLMVHSIYSNPDIFLRELISNASDALDKLRYEQITNRDLAASSELQITLEPNPGAWTLAVHDNGIGMTRAEVQEYIGTIARSGSREFLRLLKERNVEELPPELIGQFGVGFYSSFIVADKVTLLTRKAGEETATKWESTGDGTYTLEETTREEQGTSVILHLKPESEDLNTSEYLREWKIREIVRHYSDYVAYPIRMEVERTESAGKEGEEPKTVRKMETLNSMKAIWTRPESEVPEEEYSEFYKHISHDWADPLKRISYRAEGTQEFRALLFIPQKAPFNLYMPDSEQGVHLYVRRVFIMSDCTALIPEYLRFVRGVVDSEDLPLNVSREILQSNRLINVIKRALTKKVLDTLRDLQKNDRATYETFWTEFGRVVKEGIYHDTNNRETILGLALFESTHAEGKTTLADYVDRMKEGQEKIYFLTGESRRAIERSPHLESFKEKGYEVLFLTDPVDELWTQSVHEFEGKPLQSAGKGKADLGTDEEKKQREEELEQKKEDYGSFLEALQEQLKDHIKEVRLSTRLTSSPACLVGETGDLSPQLEQLLRASGQEVPTTRRILELNPEHSIVTGLRGVYDQDRADPRIQQYARLLYGQAVLAESGDLEDPHEFSELVAELMAKAL